MNLVEHIQGMPGTATRKRVGVDGLSPLFDGLLRMAFPQRGSSGCSPSCSNLRRVKLDAEIDCLRIAAATAEAAIVAAAQQVRPGATGKQLQAAYLARMCELGTSQFAQQGTFNTFGPGGELRFATDARPLADGAAVALAGGVLWAGYEGSLARTWWCGRGAPPAGLRRLHDGWQQAFADVREACRPGSRERTCWRCSARPGRIPRTARSTRSGLGHEGPLAAAWLDSAAAGRQQLQQNMVLAIRMLLRGDGFGYLAEDMVAVGPEGAQSVTTLGYGPLAR